MMQEQHNPKEKSTSEVRFVNVDAVSDEQLIVLYRGLRLIADQNRLTHDLFDQMLVGDELGNQLAADVRGWTLRTPERIRALVARCAMSRENIDRDFAARTASSLIHYDYDFTRETLVYLMFRCDHGQGELNLYSEANDTAHDQIRILMRDHLTSDQVEQFKRQIWRHDPRHPIEPAPPPQPDS